MDQFCALRDEQYRRCTCSARLSEMRERERNFSAAGGMMKDFEGNNLNVVGKTAAEVRAMYKASEGEAAAEAAKNESASVKTLSGISDVLANKNTDTAGNMGNMTDIWGTTDLVGGADLASLESTALYNAVHEQCAEMVAASCGRSATFNMVSAAYGMYIEQDCTAYADSLDKQQKQMVLATKQAKGALAAARLENYDAHNADEINACLNNVRNDMFGPAACGPDNVRCIDYTGRYVDAITGDPIYSSEFFMLEKAISLAGDTLQNSVNVPYVNMLNGRKKAAAGSLDKCRDVADQVWDEYLRQTLVDLSQRQSAKIRDVRNECVGVINECYDEKTGQLKQFAGEIANDATGVQQIELTEQLCQSKLDSCAILFGGGPPGLQVLRDYVKGTQVAKLETACEKALDDYVKSLCTPVNDNLHAYPYQCRLYKVGTYTPKDQDSNLYYRLRSKAAESCSLAGDANELSNEVEMLIGKIMDDVKLKMDGMLTTECEKIDGVRWYTRIFGTWSDDSVQSENIVEFTQNVGADSSWGACRMACPANSHWIGGTDIAIGSSNEYCQCNQDKEEECKKPEYEGYNNPVNDTGDDLFYDLTKEEELKPLKPDMNNNCQCGCSYMKDECPGDLLPEKGLTGKETVDKKPIEGCKCSCQNFTSCPPGLVPEKRGTTCGCMCSSDPCPSGKSRDPSKNCACVCDVAYDPATQTIDSNCNVSCNLNCINNTTATPVGNKCECRCSTSPLCDDSTNQIKDLNDNCICKCKNITGATVDFNTSTNKCEYKCSGITCSGIQIPDTSNQCICRNP
ncbi:MAG: hypothetical protein LBL21_05035 [Rickettsiales bacterium]|jgi:hypothetical protein|nr:hypothetical protein [Rickettsiales bacterium]